MERVLSQEERLKRAEEIYYRRKNQISAPKSTTVNIGIKKNYKFFKKIIIQMIICVCIYGVIYNLQRNTDSFSIDSINYLKSAIAYDIDFEKIKQYLSTLSLKKTDNEIVENNVVENIIEQKSETNSNLIEATLGTSEQSNENNEIEPQEEVSSVSQMEQDAEYVKNNFSFIKPLTTGTVTSRFGLRNPTTATVPKYHTGIDIGVPEGTIITAAMEGTVELVSSIGDYRKSYKNNKWRSNDFVCSL